MIHFDLPKEQSSIIKVIGVGGGGSNAVNFMFSQDIEGVNFVICNTDAQSIALSRVPNKVQLGPHLTQGLGAGANPEIGRQATEESLEEIKRILEVNTILVFTSRIRLISSRLSSVACRPISGFAPAPKPCVR